MVKVMSLRSRGHKFDLPAARPLVYKIINQNNKHANLEKNTEHAH